MYVDVRHCLPCRRTVLHACSSVLHSRIFCHKRILNRHCTGHFPDSQSAEQQPGSEGLFFNMLACAHSITHPTCRREKHYRVHLPQPLHADCGQFRSDDSGHRVMTARQGHDCPQLTEVLTEGAQHGHLCAQNSESTFWMGRAGARTWMARFRASALNTRSTHAATRLASSHRSATSSVVRSENRGTTRIGLTSMCPAGRALSTEHGIAKDCRLQGISICYREGWRCAVGVHLRPVCEGLQRCVKQRGRYDSGKVCKAERQIRGQERLD